jgi:hypothetical protein
VPSLPGYFMSTLSRRDGWNLTDTAKLFNELMVDLLGYKKYVGQGGDWVRNKFGRHISVANSNHCTGCNDHACHEQPLCGLYALRAL